MKNFKRHVLKADDPNLTSTVKGIIIDMLNGKREKYIIGFPDVFREFAKITKIDPDLWDNIRDGIPKWQQAVRNAAKRHKDQTKPDPLTAGELLAIIGGGFALPCTTLPHLVKVHQFKQLTGIKMPIKPVKKKTAEKKTPLKIRSPVNKLVQAIRRIVHNLDVEFRRDVVLAINQQISDWMEWDEREPWEEDDDWEEDNL